MELRCFVAVMLACVINVGVCYGADGQLRCSPLYFGPNAMPVPPMLHGRVSDRLCVEAGYDLYAGFYGDITHNPAYRAEWMKLNAYEYNTVNSHGKSVRIQEVGWAAPDETPTHLVLQFASSHGGAYIGSPGNSLWVDNVKLVY